MRKKLDTRFPASRIKKIMQADEDVGKIAMAVPLLVSKALELFLQDLCDRTYEITLQRGARTITSVHLKQCVQSFSVYDFLREIVSRVPDLGGTHGGGEDRTAAKRRKGIDNEDHAADEESKRSRMNGSGQMGTGGRGRGRGRGRSRGRGSRIEVDGICVKHEKTEGGLGSHGAQAAKLENEAVALESNENLPFCRNAEAAVRNFDLNIGREGNEGRALISTTSQASTMVKPAPDANTMLEEFPGWALGDMDGVAFDSTEFASLNNDRAEDEEDYDAEDYDDEA